jgi:hypothetical protein
MSEKKLSETFNRIMAMKPSVDHSLFSAPDEEAQSSLENVLAGYDTQGRKANMANFPQPSHHSEDVKAKRQDMKNLRTKQTHTRIIAQHIAFKVQ